MSGQRPLIGRGVSRPIVLRTVADGQCVSSATNEPARPSLFDLFSGHQVKFASFLGGFSRNHGGRMSM